MEQQAGADKVFAILAETRLLDLLSGFRSDRHGRRTTAGDIIHEEVWLKWLLIYAAPAQHTYLVVRAVYETYHARLARVREARQADPADTGLARLEADLISDHDWLPDALRSAEANLITWLTQVMNVPYVLRYYQEEIDAILMDELDGDARNDALTFVAYMSV